jgi:two-component system, cell cycle sensor histidine kinase and response regulator CckA
VYFPALASPAGSEAAPEPERDDWRGEGAVLLADDEPAPRGITARLLAAIGFEPVLANGGPEAVRRFEEDPGRFRLAVLDVVMPGLDGPGVCHRLRELHPGLPVLFISGYDDDGLQNELTDPATDFLQKPFKLAELRSRLRRLSRSAD